MDDIHLHWESYFQKYGVLANVPYSKFQAMEGWDTVYTWDSLKEHKPALTHTYGKKVTKLSLMVIVTPITTEIGDNYFLNKLHEPACIKRKSVYYGTKVAGKRNRVQIVICPYCRVLSQNSPSSCSHIWRHLGLAFACGGCRRFCTEAPKRLQEHLGKCKEALAAKAAVDLAASRNEAGKGGRNSWRHLPPSLYHFPMVASKCPDIFVCSDQEQGGRTSMLDIQGDSLHSQ